MRKSAPKSFVVVETDAGSLAEGSICWTERARSRGAPGVPSPGHGFTRIPQELGKDLCISRAGRKWGASSANQGRPEKKRKGGRGGVRTGRTDENGELEAEMRRDPEEGSGEQDDAAVKRNMTIRRSRIKNVNKT